MNIHRALADVAEIRLQLDRAAQYRGFRSTATGLSALLVVLGSVAHWYWVTQPVTQLDRILVIWISVAAVSAVSAGTEMFVRGLRLGSHQVWCTHRTLVENLTPSLVVGAAITMLVVNQSTDQSLVGALPGVWAMLFGLGLWNCRGDLPIGASWIALFYLLGGMSAMFFDWQSHQVFVIQMVILFGLGQALLGYVLFWNFERRGNQ